MGVTVGALAVGLSIAELTLNPTVQTTIGDGVTSAIRRSNVTISSHTRNERRLRRDDGVRRRDCWVSSGSQLETDVIRADVATHVGDRATIHGATGVDVTSQSQIKLHDNAIVDTSGGIGLQRATAIETINTGASTTLARDASVMAERGIVNIRSQNDVDVRSLTYARFLGLGGGAEATSSTTIYGLDDANARRNGARCRQLDHGIPSQHRCQRQFNSSSIPTHRDSTCRRRIRRHHFQNRCRLECRRNQLDRRHDHRSRHHVTSAPTDHQRQQFR